jgi:chromosome segregation ATPase
MFWLQERVTELEARVAKLEEDLAASRAEVTKIKKRAEESGTDFASWGGGGQETAELLREIAHTQKVAEWCHCNDQSVTVIDPSNFETMGKPRLHTPTSARTPRERAVSGADMDKARALLQGVLSEIPEQEAQAASDGMEEADKRYEEAKAALRTAFDEATAAKKVVLEVTEKTASMRARLQNAKSLMKQS